MLDNIFRETRYVIKSGDFFSEPYTSNVGVPQGDPISPILFNLFISDLPLSLQHNGITLHGCNIPYIQYADDLCILADTPEDLQRALTNLETYCTINSIEINVPKSKIMVFHRGRLPHCNFVLNGREVDLVNEFCYLGFTFTVQLSFSKHAQQVTSRARSKCGVLFAQLPLLDLPLGIVLDLFNIFILPVFTYGLPLYINNCPNSALQAIDATLTKYLKRYLQVPLHSNNATVHFVTGTIPLSSTLKHLAPNNMGSFTFPEDFNGYTISFLSSLTPHHLSRSFNAT